MSHRLEDAGDGILGEPVDLQARDELAQLARDVLEVCAGEKVGLLLSEQNIWFARKCTESVYVISTGRIVFHGDWAAFDAAGEGELDLKNTRRDGAWADGSRCAGSA